MKRIVLSAILLLAALPLVSQETTQSSGKSPRHFYRLTYVLKESDEGKVINQRTFSMTASTGDRYSSRLRAGSRYPVRDADKTNYLDIGVNIDTRLEDGPAGLEMDATSEISSAGTDNVTGSAAPVIRQVRANSLAVVAPNKPTTLFTIDDPASRHRFELEVTAVPQK